MSGEVVVCRVGTPIGEFEAVFTGCGLALLLFPDQPPDLGAAWAQRRHPDAPITDGSHDPRVAHLQQELTDYFEGRLRAFTTPLDMHGTPFQQRVWQEVYRVDYAGLCSYADIARAIGSPNAVRAVGAANGANPVPVIVPCHRIIGSNGKLVGYGGGLDMKRRLLELEGAMFAVGSR